MWEYKRLVLEIFKLIDLSSELAKLGSDNWEIIYYDEQKPEKFGVPYKITILSKRLKTDMK